MGAGRHPQRFTGPDCEIAESLPTSQPLCNAGPRTQPPSPPKPDGVHPGDPRRSKGHVDRILRTACAERGQAPPRQRPRCRGLVQRAAHSRPPGLAGAACADPALQPPSHHRYRRLPLRKAEHAVERRRSKGGRRSGRHEQDRRSGCGHPGAQARREGAIHARSSGRGSNAGQGSRWSAATSPAIRSTLIAGQGSRIAGYTARPTAEAAWGTSGRRRPSGGERSRSC